MTVRVLGLASLATNLEDHRHAIAALVTPAGSMQARGGLFPGGGGDLVAVSAMQAKVTPHYAWIDGTSGALQAGYDFTADTEVLLTFPAGEPAVARVDRVISVVRHSAYDLSGVTAGSVEVLKGQPSGAAAALPPSCELLWEVTVPAGASAGGGGINFATAKADKRRWTVAAGGLLPVRNQAEEDALVPYPGLPIWRIDRKLSKIHDGAGWGPASRVLDTQQAWSAGVAQQDVTTAWADVAGIAPAITKEFASTRLLVRAQVTGLCTVAGSQGMVISVGVRIGVTDYQLGALPLYGSSQTANTYSSPSGERIITGVPAGAITAQLRVKRDVSNSSFALQTGTHSVTVQEIV